MSQRARLEAARALEARGLARRIALRVSSFHAAIECVRRTDFIWTGPRRIAESLDPQRGLLHFKPPLDLPDYSTRLVWHQRFSADPAHRWLRRQVIDACR
jgi:DNA-binding transcriptional LysR family regulator